MKKNIKAWIKALESGKIKQGGHVLAQKKNKSYSYCCLGVACELARKDGVNLNVEKVGSLKVYDHYEGNPPDAVLNWLGIDTFEASRYAKMNDHGTSFKEIAKRIRENNRCRALK